ncbi:glutathione S-transferase family protein [Aurantiacibacter xanthus]|uniref:Glutathione S-transferase family protein n=1 Tax=Aurantiacibacter xanthus TaxID=1784712 RepID=A0A3A1PBI7_9SPHN|nr:glutathione S-transferase family protein [Aurantiacibacter xanthus]RIV91138.1 glutathione S-transferase family protein [Aurantiacibacter xanthus]
MADYTLFFNPMSRALIAKWALEEAGADYDLFPVEWESKPAELFAANPLGKIPALIHHRAEGDLAVSEGAAICHYIAETAAPALLPNDGEKADYFRMMFFAAGPLEAAISNKAQGWVPDGERAELTLGYGSFERVAAMLDGWFAERDYVCGERFTMADVYVGSQVDWGLRFASIPAGENLDAYAARLRDRPAYAATMGGIPG